MKVTYTTMDDVEYVMRNLSPQHRAELDASGILDRVVLRKFEELVRDGTARTAWIDGNPAAILGAVREHNYATTYFITTAPYFKAGLPAIRHAREYIKSIRDLFGPLIMATRSDFPGLEKWLKIVGYRQVCEDEGCKVFVYR